MKELKPCPFCGGESHLINEAGFLGSEQYYVECQCCLATSVTTECASLEERDQDAARLEAIEAWSRREGS